MVPADLERTILLAAQYQAAGRLDEAIGLCNQVLAAAPNHPAALHLLGAIATMKGEFEKAIPLLEQVVASQPQNPGGHASLGIALAGSGRLDEAIASQDRAIALNPNYARAHCNRGAALGSAGRYADAATSLSRAIALQPNYPEALYNLGNAQVELGQVPSAMDSLNRALSLRPNYPDALHCLGNAHAAQKRFGEAIAAYRRAIELRPNYSNALGNLAHALSSVGRLDESIALYRRALAIKPDAQTHGSLILTLHYHPDSTNASIRQELDRWNMQHTAALAAEIRPHDNDRGADRKLRIGYVSPDLCRHSVARFLLPILEHHDRQRFQIICYASVARPDDMTARLRGHTDLWRDVKRLTDEQLAEQVRADRIDILIDLALHTGGNRLLAFARKPAPVQMTYLAYAGSSGMKAIDYRLTDPYLDPSGGDESGYSETSLRLPDCFWCYAPTGEEPDIAGSPARRNGYVTFGCLNNFAKVTTPTLQTWARLLKQVPASRLILHAPSPAHSPHVQPIFTAEGVEASRVMLKGHLASADYFALYNQIDIALDPFPFGGGTTTCDALWMGVPVIALAGRTAVARAGVSLLSNAGLGEFVARSPDQYIQIASGLAAATERLIELRSTLRNRMRDLSLMDASRFTGKLEQVFRDAWSKWCAS